MTRPSLPLSAARFCASIAALALAACSSGDGGTSPPKPASVQAVSATTPTATVGAALSVAPTFTVKDASGNDLGNIAVTVVVSSGGGTLVGAPTKTVAGATSVGTWTLGTTAGANTLTVTIAGLTPLVITAAGTPGAPAKIVATGGNAQTALAGAAEATPLGATVQDQFNNGVPGVTVTFAVTAGGGSVSPAQLTTNASGVASGATWRLGNKGGTQAASATANGFSATFAASIQSSFPLILRFYGPPMSIDAQTAFENAANRIRAAIISSVTPVSINDNLAGCGVTQLTGTISETTQGVIIYAGVTPIDGPGKVLGQAGPCANRPSSKLPALGVMQFDEADVQNYITSGRFEALVLHEMNHVVGFGTIWEPPPWGLGIMAGAGTTNPRFLGAAAIANCQSLGGNSNHCVPLTGVAVEMCGTAGTADSHWREVFTPNCGGANSSPLGGTAAFDTELMTGYAESTPSMPWSIMSLGSLQDLGYTVNLLAADSYTMPSLLAMARLSLQDAATTDGPREIVNRARFELTAGGRFRTIDREKK